MGTYAHAFPALSSQDEDNPRPLEVYTHIRHYPHRRRITRDPQGYTHMFGIIFTG
jgi:hypothetical protein